MGIIASGVQNVATRIATSDHIKIAGSLRKFAKTNLVLVSSFQYRVVSGGRQFDQTLRWPQRGPMQFKSSLTAKMITTLTGGL